MNSGSSATVLAYDWTSWTTIPVFGSSPRTSSFGIGNSDWVSATAADFDGEGEAAIVLVKNQHSNFVVLERAGSALNVLSARDLDSVAGQWRGITTIDWVGNGDMGTAELIAVRNPDYMTYKAYLFVYGSAVHRVQRDTAIENTKAQVAGNEYEIANEDFGFRPIDDPSQTDLLEVLRETHTNTYNMVVRLDGEYEELLRVLDATRDRCVDGQPLRIWITLVPPSLAYTLAPPADRFCSRWIDSPLSPEMEGAQRHPGIPRLRRCRPRR